MAHIVVSRPRNQYWAPLSLKIILDGQKAAALRRGQEITLEVAAGRHTVKGRVDWWRSPVPRTVGSRTVELDLADRDSIRITCQSPKLLEYYLLYFYWLFRPDRYIDLCIEGDEPPASLG